MKRVPLILFICVFTTVAQAEMNENNQQLQEKSTEPTIYDEEKLNNDLKGKDKKAVLTLLGEPAIKRTDLESNEDAGYWWYSLPEAGFFVYFRDNKVTGISVLNEQKRSREL